MPRIMSLCLWLALMAGAMSFGQQRGIVLADLTWVEAEKALTPETVVVIPIGAESKEHGPHLKLKTDYLEAEYYKRQILERADVAVSYTHLDVYKRQTNEGGNASVGRELFDSIRDWQADVDVHDAPIHLWISYRDSGGTCYMSNSEILPNPVDAGNSHINAKHLFDEIVPCGKGD